MNDCDVLIAGNGLAALTLALSLPASYRVTVLCKNRLEDTASRHAQGGIAAVLDTCDHVSDHVADTLTAGAGLCHREATEAILSHGAEAIAWLSAQGVRFDQQNNGWDLTREGGHGHRRIVHVADHTGAAVMARLIEHVRCKPQITLLEHHMALDILTDHGHACGLQVWDELHHRPLKLTAAHTVLANGGLGQIYAATTTPPECTGDGIAMALRAGCRVAYLEFVQFHPTGFAAAAENGQTFLISEAVRGEGGILLNQAGERFMPRYDARAELAPRDIVARAIAAETAAQTQDFVWLDISHRPADFIRRHFPSIDHHCRQHGIDLTRQPIPVRPVQHYTCGGIVTDTAGRSSLPQLYALGETACTGLHGANRLASNSLLECVVTARLAAASLSSTASWPADHRHLPAIASVPFDYLPTATDSDGPTAPFTRPALQALNSRHLGILRHHQGLKHAQSCLQQWWRHQPLPQTLADFENRNLLICSLALVHAAINRHNNVGAHFNVDQQPADTAGFMAAV